jgi:hypothetical protein
MSGSAASSTAFVQRLVAQITGAAMPEIERHSDAFRAVQKSDDGKYMNVEKVKQPVSQLLQDDLKGSLLTEEELETELWYRP